MEGDKEYNDRDEIYSKVVRAGKRTYFFDVKSTRGNDLYLTITESKKRFDDNGDSFYEKHKIFLYKEDFDKFDDGFNDAIKEINRLKESDPKYAESDSETSNDSDTSVSESRW